MLDKNPFIIDKFGGLNFGSPDGVFPSDQIETIPFTDALIAKNVVFTKEGNVKTRDGFSDTSGVSLATFGIPNSDVGNFSQHWKISNIAGAIQTNRWLVLFYVTGTDTGDFYDSGAVDPTTPVLSVVGCKYASVINIFGRLYISPLSAFGTPVSGEVVYLYDGTNAGRAAGGGAPVPGTFTVTNDTQTGSFVTVGKHLFTLAWETDSGFITPVPAPNTWINLDVTAAADRSVKFTNIPTFPSGVVAVHLLMTKVILNYDNVPENWELFFALRETTNADVEFTLPDTGLVNSADYLLDIFDTLPACNSISVYSGRLMYNGPDGDSQLIYVTKVADPETVSQVEDYIELKEGIPIDVYNGKELRGLYYIFKENSTFVIREDITTPPNSWKYEIVDSGVGAVPFGIAEVLANPGSLVYDNLIVMSLTGIHVFTGTYSQTLLSFKLQGYLSTLDKRLIKFSRIVVDPIKKTLYLLIVTSFGGGGNEAWGTTRLFVGNYFDGLDAQNIKWSEFTFRVLITPTEGDPYYENGNISNVLVDPADDLISYPRLTALCSNTYLDNVLKALSNGVRTDADDDDTIPWELETGFTNNELGYTYNFAYLRLRIAMSREDAADAILSSYVATYDGAFGNSGAVNTIVPATPNKYYTIPLGGYKTEHAKVHLSGKGQMYLSKLILFVSEASKNIPG